LAGMALIDVPDPEASIVTLLLEQELPIPSESMVMRPGIEAVPTVVVDPPDAASDVQPSGSRSHRAGTWSPPLGEESITADAWVVRDFSPRTPAKKLASVFAIVTLKRLHGVPSLLELKRGLAMS